MEPGLSETAVDLPTKSILYPRTCEICVKTYKNRQTFYAHKKKTCSSSYKVEKSTSYTCAHCCLSYNLKGNLRRHVQRRACFEATGKNMKCVDCNTVFHKSVHLMRHFMEKHSNVAGTLSLNFTNMGEFSKWKRDTSRDTFSYYRKTTRSKPTKDGILHYYICSFDKHLRVRTETKSRRKLKHGAGPNYNCPSRLLVCESDDVVRVTYLSNHNHALTIANAKFHRLDAETKEHIKACLREGQKPSKIRADLRSRYADIPEKQHFLSTAYIAHLKWKMAREESARESVKTIDAAGRFR